jgi:hypothetical protein
MARGNKASEGRSARSEAGTVFRGDTIQARSKRAADLLNTIGKSITINEDGSQEPTVDPLGAGIEARKILMGERPTKDAYEIRLEGSDSLKARGKLNLIEGTVDGKKINQTALGLGAFDRSGTLSRNSEEAADAFRSGKKNADREQGFIFAADDDDKVYAIPHTWDTNDPQGTVGIFRGDRITNVGDKGKVMNLRVIGTFDSSPRGLQLAAATTGDFIGRTNGIKQTATILSSSKYAVDAFVQGYQRGESVIQRAATDIQRGRLGDKSDGYGDLKKLDERLT